MSHLICPTPPTAVVHRRRLRASSADQGCPPHAVGANPGFSREDRCRCRGCASRRQRCGDPRVNVSTNDLAGLFYMSGSTGGAKGVMQSHRVVLHCVMVHTNMFGIGPTDPVSLLTSPGYSMSLRPVFSALLNGGTVCPFNVVERGIADLPRWLRRGGSASRRTPLFRPSSASLRPC